MPGEPDSIPLPPNTRGTAWARAKLGDPTVHAIPGHPDWFMADIGDLSLYVTEVQWSAIDAAVRAGIKAAS